MALKTVAPTGRATSLARVTPTAMTISHDVNTMTAAHGERAKAGQELPGLLLVPQSLEIGQAIDDLELICVASENADWERVIDFLPL